MPTATSTTAAADVEGQLSVRLRRVVGRWAQSQYELVALAADFADGDEWIFDGSPTAAHWLAAIADVETCTTREWIRVGRCLRTLPAINKAFADGLISYAKVRALTRVTEPDNETELLAIAVDTPANHLARALARWVTGTSSPEALEDHQHAQRSVSWRPEPDGMTVFTLRLPPLPAGLLIVAVTAIVMRSSPRRGLGEAWPTLGQQHADALEKLLTVGAGTRPNRTCDSRSRRRRSMTAHPSPTPWSNRSPQQHFCGP